MLWWRVTYSDGEMVNQLNRDGSTNLYDLSRPMKNFVVFNDAKPLLVLHMDEKKRLIYRQRVGIQMDGVEKFRVWLVGWQETRRGVNIQCLNFIFPDGHIEMLDKFKDNHPLFYGVVDFLPEETTDES